MGRFGCGWGSVGRVGMNFVRKLGVDFAAVTALSRTSCMHIQLGPRRPRLWRGKLVPLSRCKREAAIFPPDFRIPMRFAIGKRNSSRGLPHMIGLPAESCVRSKESQGVKARCRQCGFASRGFDQ